MKKFCFAVLMALFLVFMTIGLASAVNTTTVDNGTIVIVLDGSTDWVWNSDLSSPPAAGLIVYSIQFNTSAANDILQVVNGTAAGVPIFESVPAGGVESAIKYYPQGKRCQPVIDATDIVLGTPANALVIIEVEPW